MLRGRSWSVARFSRLRKKTGEFLIREKRKVGNEEEEAERWMTRKKVGWWGE